MSEKIFIIFIESLGFDYSPDVYKENVKDYVYSLHGIRYCISFYFKLDKIILEKVDFPNLLLFESLKNDIESRDKIISILKIELPKLFRKLKIKKLLNV